MDDHSRFILGGSASQQIEFDLSMANRHGLIAGATGTGKTVTLQVLAEQFSRQGVPVFMADVKGDLSGLASPGKPHPKIDERVASIGIEPFSFDAFPVVFWDLYGEQGHPIRTTISEFGPTLLAGVLDLNDTQTGILYTIFKIADDEGLLLLDLKDVKSLLNWVKSERKTLEADYGAMSTASLAAIQRQLLVLDEQGGNDFFGEPALDLHDLIKTDFSGKGVVSILDATRLILDSRLYAIFLLWMISELFEQLPEVGDSDKPKLVFFFDEAHLLFDNAPKLLTEKIEQVVRLIRSKGVGIYFITQSPTDIPEDVLGQLGNRVQHALRAFTPKDQKAVKVAAQTFRPNPEFQTDTVITQLGVGEALVSLLDKKGAPGIVQRTLISPPASRIGPLTADERLQRLSSSPYQGRYEALLDRESAFEVLQTRAEQKTAEPEKAVVKKPAGRPRQSAFEAMAKSAARSIGSSLGRQLVRGILGTLMGKR